MIVSGSFIEGVATEEFAPFLDAAEFEAISHFAREFPCAVHAHALELRLQADVRHADYATCLEDDVQTLGSLRRALGAGAPALCSCATLRRFLAAWSEDDSPVRRLVPLLWMEYDRPDGAFSRAPGLFLALSPDAAGPERNAALERTLALLYGGEERTRKQRAVASIEAALPGTGRVRHLGAVPSRDPAFLRLVVEGLGAAELPPLLARIAWPGDAALLARLLEMLRDEAGVEPALVDLDLLGGLRPSLGLEFLLIGADSPADDGITLLTWLTKRGWCSPEKFEALCGWLRWTTRESPDMAPLAYWQKLYHVKLTLQEGAPRVGAKAYWGVWAGPRPGTLRELHTALRTRR